MKNTSEDRGLGMIPGTRTIRGGSVGLPVPEVSIPDTCSCQDLMPEIRGGLEIFQYFESLEVDGEARTVMNGTEGSVLEVEV